MKQILSLFITVVFMQTAKAQEPSDALRNAWNVQSGTARVQAIGGAVGSLGGDITATFVNPAGLAFYRTGDAVLSSNYTFGNTSATYLGRKEKLSTNKFSFGTTGVVFGGSDDRKDKNVAVSLAINQMADFKSNILYRGANNASSYSQKFLEEIGNNNLKDANAVAGNYPFGTSLAFNTYWIDTINGGSSNNYRFQTRAPIATGLLQQNTIATTGGITEFALGVGASLNKKLMVGGTLGIPLLRYDRETVFIEQDATTNTGNKFNYANYRQTLSTSGVGFNIKAGLIYKPQEYWRLGLAIHSPTVYSLTDKNGAEITTDTEGYKGTQTQKLEDVSGAASEFKYMQVTPLKVIASASYVLREVQDVTRQKGFITADVEYIAYPMASFLTDSENGNDQSTTDYLKSVNKAVTNAYKGAFNFRAGGELKFTTLMVRAGIAYYGNPYKNIHNESGSKLNLSGGLGYRNKGFFIDATYVYGINKDVDVAYRLQSGTYYNAAINNTTGKALLTLGVKI